MIRRKLFTYTIILIAGITAGYTALDKGAPFEAGLFVVSMIAAWLILKGIINGDERHENNSDELLFNFILIFIIGFVSFFIANLNMRTLPDSEIQNIDSFTGIVSSVSTYQDRIVIVLDDVQETDGGNIRCTIRHDEQDRRKTDGYEIIGRRLKINGGIDIPEPARNPGCFDYRLYLRTKRIKYISSAASYEVISDYVSPTFLIRKVMLKKREDFIDKFDDETGGFIKGVLFGDRSSIDEKTYDDFTMNGTAHILAVSGLHVGFILSMLKMLSKTRRTAGSALMIVLIVMLYGEMTMWNASTVRAVIIMIIGMFGMYIEKEFDLLSAISAAAFIMLIFNPYNLFNAGFDMSFLAITGIATVGNTIKPFFGSSLSYILSIQIAIAPYTAFSFNRFNPLSMLINIPVVYIVSLLVPFALLTFVLGMTIGTYPELLIDTIGLMSDATVKINSALSFGGSYSADVTSVDAGILISVYLVILLMSSEMFRVMVIRKDYRVIKRLIAATFIVSLTLIFIFGNEFRSDEIVFIDVGQGDAIHVRTRGSDVMFDGGGNYMRNIGEDVLKPYYLKNGVSGLDAVILSHLHIDHYKGAEELSEIYPVHSFVISDIYRNYSKSPPGATYIATGNYVMISERDDVRADIIWPIYEDSRGYSDSDLDENERNMVVMLRYGNVKVMITGDLMAEDERDMVQYYAGTDTLNCDVLKVAHHGSKTSTTEEFLDAVDPGIAVIQVGRNNTYGHPASETIDRLEDRNIKVYRTDESGAIGLDIKGNNIYVHRMIG